MAEVFGKYCCSNCQDEIPGIHVLCAECIDFVLCLQCFAAGAEIGPHKHNHKYQLKKGHVKEVKKGGWTAREELYLLDALEKYTFGNWEDISKHIETRSPEDAKEHYINKFLNGTIGKHTWGAGNEQRPKLTDHTVPDKGPLSQLLTQKLPPLDITAEEAAQLHYKPERNDFERLYDPGAEKLVSSLSLNPSNDDTDIVLKLAILDQYTRRLRERTKRHRMVRDYQLALSFFRGNQRSMNKEQREFRDRFRVFAQFYTSLEFDRRLSLFHREKGLRLRLSELCRYRWNGLTKLDECTHFEQHAAVIQNKNTGPYGLQGKTLACIIGPNGQRMPGCIRQCLTGQPSQWRTPPVVYALSSKKGRDYYDGSLHSRNYSDNISQRAEVPPHNQKQIDRKDVAQQPGGDLLSSNELQLCSNLNLPATHYLTLKTVLLSGANIPDPNSSIVSSVKRYLTKAGWLQAAAAAAN